MSEITGVDSLLALVHKSVRQFGLADEGPMGQQILLLGDTFYGYRFTSKGFTAVWSAADQVMNVFDQNGMRLGSSLITIGKEEITETGASIRLTDSDRLRNVA